MTFKTSIRDIYDVADLPSAGLVPLRDFTSNVKQRKMLPISALTYKRGAAEGTLPPVIHLMGRPCVRAEQLRALALGQDWTKVQIGEPAERESA